MKNQQPILISFLGKSYASEEGYREATYQIEDFECTTAYSAFALSQHINPKKIIILGTSGSMWDVLIEAHATGSKEEDSKLGTKHMQLQYLINMHNKPATKNPWQRQKPQKIYEKVTKKFPYIYLFNF